MSDDNKFQNVMRLYIVTKNDNFFIHFLKQPIIQFNSF